MSLLHCYHTQYTTFLILQPITIHYAHQFTGISAHRQYLMHSRAAIPWHENQEQKMSRRYSFSVRMAALCADKRMLTSALAEQSLLRAHELGRCARESTSRAAATASGSAPCCARTCSRFVIMSIAMYVPVRPTPALQ